MNHTEPKKILFVCLGNICRSPAAEGIFRRMVEKQGLADRFVIDSAGTYGGHAGELPDSRMRAAASRRGYELTHRSRKLTEDDFRLFDMVIVMDDSNYERASRTAPDMESVAKLHRMTDFARKHVWDHIPDPYYEGAEGFELVLDLLEDCLSGLLDSITRGDE
ncbi:MAG: low molecular weight phosphotyrosine protein phosphatase [Rikenellaceae bacterium]|nr:low molecular weight phosphotyrosine protein phosphatase [Rikenellaceae bacterium]